MGISYGTRAALEYLRLYPQHVRRVVLDGVAPPDMALPESFDIDGRAALDKLLRDCAAGRPARGRIRRSPTRGSACWPRCRARSTPPRPR